MSKRTKMNMVGQRSRTDEECSAEQCGKWGRFYFCSGTFTDYSPHNMAFCDQHLKRARQNQNGNLVTGWYCADCIARHQSKPEVYGELELLDDES